MVCVYFDGETITHTNTRSSEKGRYGDGMNVAWRATSSGEARHKYNDGLWE